MKKGKCIIFSAPSGAGKTTIVRHLLEQGLPIEFSVSACSREPRGHEKDGVDYYFLGIEGFKQKIAEGAFAEWEEVYPGRYYGTLRSEVERLWAEGKVVAFDIDVVGGRNLKQQFGDRALALFVAPPSLEVLGQRLRGRGTETEDQITQRLAKAEWELAQAPDFDRVVVNDDLDRAESEALAAILAFAPSCA